MLELNDKKPARKPSLHVSSFALVLACGPCSICLRGEVGVGSVALSGVCPMSWGGAARANVVSGCRRGKALLVSWEAESGPMDP